MGKGEPNVARRLAAYLDRGELTFAETSELVMDVADLERPDDNDEDNIAAAVNTMDLCEALGLGGRMLMFGWPALLAAVRTMRSDRDALEAAVRKLLDGRPSQLPENLNDLRLLIDAQQKERRG